MTGLRAAQESDWYDEQRDKWVAAAETWHEGRPPAVPSSEDLEAFCRLAAAAGGPNARIVVLGATVGLRRALLGDPRLREAELTTVDFSAEMLRVTTAALVNSDLDRERRVLADWRDLPEVVDGQVDAILADKSFDNVAFADWGTLFESCAEILVNRGRLVPHVGLVDPAYRGLTPAKAVAIWVDRIDRGECTLDAAASGFWEDLLTASAYIGDPAEHELSVSKFSSELDRLRSDPATTGVAAAILELFDERFGDSATARWTAFDLDDLDASAHPWFERGELCFSTDYAAARTQPVVELVRR